MLLIRSLLLISAASLGLGLCLPVMEVIPRLGAFHDYISFFMKELQVHQSFSILEGVQALLREGHYFVAFLIAVFSILFPLWKLGVLWSGFAALVQKESPGKAFHIAEKLGKYSMVDVFVIALLVVAIKGLPGGSRVILQPGLFLFAFSVVLAMIASWLIEKGWLQNRDSNSQEKG